MLLAIGVVFCFELSSGSFLRFSTHGFKCSPTGFHRLANIHAKPTKKKPNNEYLKIKFIVRLSFKAGKFFPVFLPRNKNYLVNSYSLR